MKRKTEVEAAPGAPDLLIVREFQIPLELLFRAYSEAALFEEWMGTKLLHFEARAGGGYRFETCTPQGVPVFQAHGVFHEFSPGSRITRTFEMAGAPFGAQLEFLEFDALDEERSLLRMQSIYRSPELRDLMLRQPFAAGLNSAHNRLEAIFSAQKTQS